MPDIVLCTKDVRVNLEIQGFHPNGAFGLMGESFGFGSWSKFQYGGWFPPTPTILSHRQGVQEFNSVVTLSTQGWHQIPQVKGSVL